MCLCVSVCVPVCVCVSRAAERGGQLGHFALGPTLLMGPKRSIYSNRTLKYSIKAVTPYILPWAPQALSAALCVSVCAFVLCVRLFCVCFVCACVYVWVSTSERQFACSFVCGWVGIAWVVLMHAKF